MTGERTVVLELTRIEAIHLRGLVTQFAELLDASGAGRADPAIARLVPDAYADDAEAAREFRSLTESDLLSRRREDAAVVLQSLSGAATLPADVSDEDPALREAVDVRLDPAMLQAWLRCLAALRLVLAERLGIHTDDDADHDEDPRFAIYDWLGYRLDSLVTAASDGL